MDVMSVSAPKQVLLFFQLVSPAPVPALMSEPPAECIVLMDSAEMPAGASNVRVLKRVLLFFQLVSPVPVPVLISERPAECLVLMDSEEMPMDASNANAQTQHLLPYQRLMEMSTVLGVPPAESIVTTGLRKVRTDATFANVLKPL